MKYFIKDTKRYFKNRKNYSVKYDSIWLNNRWKRRIYARSSDWTILGFGKRYFSPNEFEYYFAFFGFDLRIFLKKVWKVD